MSIEQAVEFVLQALEAIADAHGLGIIHRDLKPANLFCVRRSDGLFSIKLLDFGISKAQDPRSSDDHGDITAPAVVMGSPLYMSPEQMRSAREVDARTDIWSIGVILYELLTGVAPFAGTTVSEICVKAASEAPVPMRTLRPDLPLELEAVILKCLEKDRAHRFGNVAELAAKLMPFAPKRARPSVERIARIIAAAGIVAAMPELPPASVAAPQSVRTDGNWGQTKARVQLARRGIAGAVVTALAILGGAGIWAARPKPSAPANRALSGSTIAPLSPSLPSPAGAVEVFPVPAASSAHARQLAPSPSTANGQPLERLPTTEQRPATPSGLPAASKKLPSEKRDLFDTPH